MKATLFKSAVFCAVMCSLLASAAPGVSNFVRFRDYPDMEKRILHEIRDDSDVEKRILSKIKRDLTLEERGLSQIRDFPLLEERQIVSREGDPADRVAHGEVTNKARSKSE